MLFAKRKRLPRKEGVRFFINVPHLSGRLIWCPAGFGTAALRGCRASLGRFPLVKRKKRFLESMSSKSFHKPQIPNKKN